MLKTNLSEAIVDFLKNFKSSSTEAADQLEGLDLNGDDDEYDMVDDADDVAPGAERRNRHNKLKYMQLLQDVADRIESTIFIDLDDVDAVSAPRRTRCGHN